MFIHFNIEIKAKERVFIAAITSSLHADQSDGRLPGDHMTTCLPGADGSLHFQERVSEAAPSEHRDKRPG